MKWIKKNILVFMLVGIYFLIAGFPLFALGVFKTFDFSIDPDVVYATNAVLYTKHHLISYVDHPGTPSILLFSYAYMPLRLLSKYLFHTNFIQWSFDNFAYLIYYLRIFQLLIFSMGLFIYLKVIKKVTASIWMVISAFLSIFLIMGGSGNFYIGPESFSFLLTAIWLAIFTKFVKTDRYSWGFLLSFISGIAIANKFTNLPLFIVSIIVPFFVLKNDFKSKIITAISNLTIFTLSFFIGIWPIRGAFYAIFNWVIKLFTHTEKYGYGTNAVFDWASYSKSAIELVTYYPATFAFILFTFVLLMILLIRKKIKIFEPTVLLSVVVFCVIALFIKYPTIHYLYINIALLIYCCIYFLSKTSVIWVKVITAALLIYFIFSVKDKFNLNYNKPSIDSNSINKILEHWTPLWSADVYREQLDKIK